jgi:chaperone modulatory protein CbpM
MEHVVLLSSHPGEILDQSALTVEELAHACGVAPDWVHARVEADAFQADTTSGAWRFDSVTLIRARRIAQLESIYDADPELAALTTDLIEEVTRLRRRLETLRAGEAHTIE